MISAIIPLKKNSVRVPNKNFKPFGDTSLARNKIRTLLRNDNVDKIIVNSDDSDVLRWVESKFSSPKIEYVLREPYYASSECNGSNFFQNIAENADSDSLIYSPVTSPFVDNAILSKAIEKYQEGEYDSVVSVHDQKHHMWMHGKPLNYDIKSSPNSQDLPSVFKVTYGFGIISREMMIKNRNIIGDNPFLFEINEIQAVDIDTDLDFQFAEYLYTNGYVPSLI